MRVLLIRTIGEPLFDHGEAIAAPKRLVFDENSRRTEDAAGDGRFAIPTRDRLHLGTGHAC